MCKCCCGALVRLCRGKDGFGFKYTLVSGVTNELHTHSICSHCLIMSRRDLTWELMDGLLCRLLQYQMPSQSQICNWRPGRRTGSHCLLTSQEDQCFLMAIIWHTHTHCYTQTPLAQLDAGFTAASCLSVWQWGAIREGGQYQIQMWAGC